MDVIVHRLNGATISRKRRVIRLTCLAAEEIDRHMLDGVQSKPVTFGHVKRPRNCPTFVSRDVFRHRLAFSVKRPPARPAPPCSQERTVGVHVQVRSVGKADKDRLVGGITQRRTEIVIQGSRFIRQIAQALQRLVFNVLHAAPIAHIRPVLITARDSLQMKILGNQPGIIVGGITRPGITRHIRAAMIHHIIEINANSKTMGGLDHLD